MATIPNIVLFILLGVIVYQDFKFRAIHALLLVGVFICASSLLWLQEESLEFLLHNSIFIGVVIFFLWIYVSIKNKTTINSLNKSMGIGDVMFFFAVAPLFSLKNYMLFFISGMVITLLFYYIFKNSIKTGLIPLAGILSGYLIVLIMFSILFHIDLFHKPILIQAFGN